MAGFFSLGSGSGSGRQTPPPQQQQQQQHQTNTTENANNSPNWGANQGLLLYRNEEIHQKGFEIWQQYVQVHHHHHHQKPQQQFLHPAAASLYLGGADQMAGPSSSAAWARPSSSSGPRVMIRGAGGSGAINCQDCGNQAKKDCSHMRCRTCCKSRGFDCATHVKSTWVPAAKRRERQQQHQRIQELEIGTRDKRQRDATHHSHPNADHNNNTNNNDALVSRMGASTSSGLELGQHFPPEVSSPAVFRCVRVHSVDNTDEQLAYQTAVNIGGHLFKGILYDQGADTNYPTAAGETSSGCEPTLHRHNRLPANDSENPGGSGSAAMTGVDPNSIYPPPISAFLAGTQFFPPPRS